MQDASLTIGQVAARAGVSTSAVRYYERRGLLAADARQSGQRRYTQATLRRLVFIGMLQDAGLALDEIVGVLDAPTVADWKAIASRRLDLLDEEIHRLQLARTYLAGARSEEHTSELQSLMRISYAVFCLKKKKNTQKE